jgi:peptidoglycan/xylan/chitin deacetylase (PgdA/CDA1 family)
MAISSEAFEKIIAELKSCTRVVSLRQALDQLKHGQEFEYPTVALTFDDGYVDNYNIAFPILRKYDMPASIFLTTGPVEKKDLLWWDRLQHIISSGWEHGGLSFFSGSPLSAVKPVAQNTNLNTFINLSVDYLNSINRLEREAFWCQLESWLEDKSLPDPPQLMMTWEMVREMALHNIEFESHTVNHMFLDELTPQEICKETLPGRDRIRELTGQSADILACPRGRNMDQDQLDAIKSEFNAVCTTQPGINNFNTDLFGLKHKDANFFLIDQKFHGGNFRAEILGLWDFLRKFKTRVL